MKRDRPLYGKSGRLDFLISINPQLKSPDLIKVGQCVFLSTQRRSPSQVDTMEKGYHEKQSSVRDSTSKDLKLVTIDFAPTFSTRRIDAVEDNGSRASALSDLGYGAKIGLQFNWGNNVFSKTSFTYEKFSFDVDSNKSIENSSASLFIFDTELVKQFGSLSHGLGFSYDRGILLLAKDISTLSFTKVDYLKAYYHIAYQLYQFKKLAFSPYAYFKYHLSTNAAKPALSIDSGYEVLPGYRISYEKAYGVFYLDMYYRLVKTEATNWSQDDRQLGLLFGLLRDF